MKTVPTAIQRPYQGGEKYPGSARGAQMKSQEIRSGEFNKAISVAIADFTVEGARSVQGFPQGSFALWLSADLERRRIQDWRTYCEASIWQACPRPEELNQEKIGLLLANDIITYAATCLPRSHAKSIQRKLFGYRSNKVSCAELLLIGHALWRPAFPIYFNPYTREAIPLTWQEVCAFENLRRREQERSKHY